MLRKFSIRYSTARILWNLETYSRLHLSYSRPFSCLGPADNQQGKDDIANWVRSSLNEPIPSQHFPRAVGNQVLNPNRTSHLCPLIQVVSEEEFCEEWYLRFRRGDSEVVNTVLKKIREDRVFFRFGQIEMLLGTLKYLRRNFDGHKIFCAYRDFLPYLRQDDDDNEAYCKFLETTLRIENSLANYKICEELFSEYIKFPNIKPEVITVGLRSFLENNNLQLAREFYMQALSNPDAFPMGDKQLTELLRLLSDHREYRSVRTFFNLWLKKKCQAESDGTDHQPSFSALSLVHRTYLKTNDKDGLVDFLSQDVVQKTGYPWDVSRELNDFYHALHCGSLILQSDIETRIQEFAAKLSSNQKKREEFYLFLLNSFALSKDFANLKFVLCLIQKDCEIELKPKFHLAIARYFVNQGMLHNLLEYYSDVLRRGGPDCLQLRVSIINQLCRCASYSHPALTKEIINEFKVILSRDMYITEFPQLRQFLRKLSRIRLKGIHGNEEFGILEMSQVDYDRLEMFEKFVCRGDLAGARLFILENLRQGIQPSFNFHYCILQKCLNLQLPSLAKTLDDLFSGVYKEVPVKLKILWLRYEILTQYNTLLTHEELFSVAKIKVLASRLQDFERQYQSALNFRSYMQLTQISLSIREYTTSELLLQRAISLMDERDKRHWQIYYLTSLKLAARIYDMNTFLKLVNEWIENSRASWITHDCLRQVKSFAKLFAKREDSIPNYDENLRLEIASSCERLVHKYTSLKFEGLDSMRVLSKFLKDWLDMEMRYRAKLLKSRRAELETQLSEESANASGIEIDNYM